MASEEEPSVPPKRALGEAPPGDPPGLEALRREAETGLGDLTEELTLDVLSRLDLLSLAATKRVCRRLHRIASDASLLGRVSVVQFILRRHSESFFRTDCLQLGPLQMPENPKLAGKKFLALVEWLLEGEAPLVSVAVVKRPSVGFEEEDGFVLAPLGSLLTKRKVELRMLACSQDSPDLLALLRSQPALVHLCLRQLPSPQDTDVAEIVRCLPSLRHLTLLKGKSGPGWLLEKLVPQLRSLLLLNAEVWYGPPAFQLSCDEESLNRIRDASGGRLLFRAVGQVSPNRVPLQAHHVHHIRPMAFAVEDFRREERGRLLLSKGEPWDPWDKAEQRIPQPTLDNESVFAFVHTEAHRQKRQREWERQDAARKKRLPSNKNH